MRQTLDQVEDKRGIVYTDGDLHGRRKDKKYLSLNIVLSLGPQEQAEARLQQRVSDDYEHVLPSEHDATLDAAEVAKPAPQIEVEYAAPEFDAAGPGSVQQI